tara:strand:- start:573 stop:719 length:147 start_codon:yes stop_codon:yes gene_type:complete
VNDEQIPLRIPANPPLEWIKYIEEQEKKKKEEGKNKTSSTGSVVIIDL